MKYEAGSEYLFECNVVVNGIHAKVVEEELKSLFFQFIKQKQVQKSIIANECIDKKFRVGNIFHVLEEMQFLKNGKIVHIGRIPEPWKEELIEQMKEKEECDERRMLHLDDCIIICVEKENIVTAVVIDRKGIYSLSKNPPS